MSPRTKSTFASLALLFSTLACVTLLGNDLPEDAASPSFPATQLPITEIPATQEASVSCPVITDQIIELAVLGGEDVEEVPCYIRVLG